MLTLGVLIALGETEIDDVDIVFCALVAANEEVIRLDISVDYSLVMHFLNTGNHLMTNMAHSFEVKLSSALLEKIL